MFLIRWDCSASENALLSRKEFFRGFMIFSHDPFFREKSRKS